MTSARPNRDGGHRQQPVDPAPFRPALRAAVDAGDGPTVSQLGLEVQQQLVLRVLVERFGGEVTCADLTRALTKEPGRIQSSLGSRVIDVLQTLHRSGALSMEPNGENDFIVRLLPDGARRYI